MVPVCRGQPFSGERRKGRKNPGPQPDTTSYVVMFEMIVMTVMVVMVVMAVMVVMVVMVVLVWSGPDLGAVRPPSVYTRHVNIEPKRQCQIEVQDLCGPSTKFPRNES